MLRVLNQLIYDSAGTLHLVINIQDSYQSRPQSASVLDPYPLWDVSWPSISFIYAPQEVSTAGGSSINRSLPWFLTFNSMQLDAVAAADTASATAHHRLRSSSRELGLGVVVYNCVDTSWPSNSFIYASQGASTAVELRWHTKLRIIQIF